MHGYTVIDLLCAMEGAALLSLVFIPPGFLLGYASNLLVFRERSSAERLLWSIVLSVSISPILAVLLVRFSSLSIAASFFLLASVASILLVVRELLSKGAKNWSPDRTTWIALWMMAVWVLLAMFALVDWQLGDRLYVSYVAYDHAVRTSLVDAAARTGVPPRNPFFGIGGAPVLRYYYYWYVICAFPVHLAGVSPRASLNGSILWSGFALAALIPLYLKHYCGERENLRFKSVVGIGLLMVTGYDLIPFVLLSLRFRAVWGDLEWWDTNQVVSWIGSLLWVPHHVAALIACLTGFLLLSALPDNAGVRERTWTALIAGAAFSSAAGLSVYVTFVFGIYIVVWALAILVLKGPNQFFTYIGAGAFCVLLALPYLNDLQGSSTAGTKFAFFAFRDYPVVQLWLRHQGVTNSLALNFSRLPTLLIVYFLEFGLYFWVLWYCLRREIRSRTKTPLCQCAAWLMISLSLLTVSVLASDSSSNNDLGSRGVLVAQFVLLIWAAPLVSELFHPEGRKRLGRVWVLGLSVSLLLGALGTISQIALLRGYAPIVDAGISQRTEPWIGNAPGFGSRTLRLRTSLDHMKANVARTAVVQYNPATVDLNVFHLYANRQTGVGDDSCQAAFGGDLEKCKQAYPYIFAAFNSPDIVRGWNLDQFCEAFQINVLIATNSDPIWKDFGSWVWTRPTLFADDTLRVITCGKYSQSR